MSSNKSQKVKLVYYYTNYISVELFGIIKSIFLDNTTFMWHRRIIDFETDDIQALIKLIVKLSSVHNEYNFKLDFYMEDDVFVIELL